MKKNPFNKIAKKLARDLFTEGITNRRASRLAMMHGFPVSDEIAGAGWSEAALADRIATLLNNAHQNGELP